MLSSDAWKAAGFGVIAGMRSMSAPAFLKQELARRSGRFGLGRLAQGRKARKVARTFTALAAGELVGDKLPSTPARIAAPVLTGRIISGAFTAATLARKRKQPVVLFALIGATAAVASSFAFYGLRRLATERLRIPNIVAGLLEDGLTLYAGNRLSAALD